MNACLFFNSLYGILCYIKSYIEGWFNKNNPSETVKKAFEVIPVMILDNIGLDHKEAPKIIEIYQKTSESLLKCMNDDYTFNTLLTHKSYKELSL